MNHFRHPSCTHVLRAAPGTESYVEPLAIRRGVFEEPEVPTVTSFWKPSEEDIANILAGGCIAVRVLGTSQPPMLVSVEV